MTNSNPSSRLVQAPAAAPELAEAHNDEMTDKTAAELRALCEEKGEPFDTSLSEGQAQERIAILKDKG